MIQKKMLCFKKNYDPKKMYYALKNIMLQKKYYDSKLLI